MASTVGREIIGQSKPVHDMLKLIARIASSKTNVLIVGESGTGKELVARLIHDSGPLKGKAFVPVNCGAIPENLIESEMFGHKRGSFTGAVADKPGLFEAANGGTLFLDEVGELPLALQVKLLRAIQERIFRRVGGTEDIRVDVRIIAATNRDLEAAVAKGTFREDLYYRLNVLLVRTPPLRERKGDVHILAESFLKRFSDRSAKKLAGFEPAAMAALESYSWPGNVRELENVIERAITLENHDVVTFDALPSGIRKAHAAASGTPKADAAASPGAPFISIAHPDFTQGPIDLPTILRDVEKKFMDAALTASGGDSSKAMTLLGMSTETPKGGRERKPK
ncbi:MAG: sigma 54-interacting transcriptional regulator [Oligoflexia bacterium]|nr:sigma 54-interacting transcriptional regulator [Oligoflexia bacterium]